MSTPFGLSMRCNPEQEQNPEHGPERDPKLGLEGPVISAKLKAHVRVDVDRASDRGLT